MRQQAQNIITSSVSFLLCRLLSGNSRRQSIIQLLASYTVTLSKLTNGKFLHTPLNCSTLCIPLLLPGF